VVNREGAFRVGRTIEPRDTHFAIRVDDWREAVARLLQNRQPFVIDPYQLGYLQLYVADPDGHIVELNAPDIAGTES
jgi:catechol 2,3-dioxygenase-like lactoylglutathione lyase family enzyme